MEIRYKDLVGAVKESTLLKTIENHSDDYYYQNTIDIACSKAELSIRFNCLVVELLHSKGLLVDDDIKELISKTIYVDKKHIEVS